MSERPPRIRVADVQAAAAAVLGLPMAVLTGADRSPRPGWCAGRQLAMLAARELTGRSLPAIGARFGRDHTTVLHGVRAAARALDRIRAAATEAAVRREAAWSRLPQPNTGRSA